MANVPSPASSKPESAQRRRSVFIAQALNHPLASFYLIAGAAALLATLGVLMVLSASSVYAEVNTGDAYYFAKRQIGFLIAGAFAAWWLSRAGEERIRPLAFWALFGALLLLLLTFTPLGVSVNDNRNWLELGSSYLKFQPSEFAKFAMVLWGADLLARRQRYLDRPRELLIPFVPVSAVLIGLVIMQKDLGTAVVMGSLLLSVLLIVGAPFRILGGIGLLAGAFVGLLTLTSANRMNRILGFLNPNADALGVNQQPLQAVYALATGGWWGTGIGASKQKWGMLVEAHTDYIFAVVGEELGLVGSLLLLGLFLILGYAGLRTALRSDQPFWKYACAGLTAWFVIQAVVNIAVVLRLLPVLGVTLPLVSYGGSSLTANLAAVGVMLAAARNEPAARALLAREPRAARTRVTTVVGSRSN